QTERLVDLPHVVHLLQAAGAIPKTGESIDGGRAQAAGYSVTVGIRNAQVLGNRRKNAVGVVDALEHARVPDARFVILAGSDRATVADHSLLAGHNDAPGPARTRAYSRLGQITRVECVRIFVAETGKDGGFTGAVIGADIELIYAIGLHGI